MMRNRHFLALLTLIFLCSLSPAAQEDSASLSEEARPYRGSPLSGGLDIQYVPISYRNYLWNGAQKVDRAGGGLHVGLEWLPITGFGKLGIGMGVGYYVIRNVSLGADRLSTLNSFPMESYLSYRFDYLKNQILVPFVKGGPSVTFLGQTGYHHPGPQIYYGLDYAGGVELCLNPLDPSAANSMDRSMGINNTYFMVEYFRSDYLDKKVGPNLAHDELRFGLRFEM